MLPTQTPQPPMNDVQGGSSSTADHPLMALLKTLRDLLTSPVATAAVDGNTDGSMPPGLMAAVDPATKDSKVDTRDEGAAQLADSDDMSSDGQDSTPASPHAGLKGAMSKLAAKRKPAAGKGSY